MPPFYLLLLFLPDILRMLSPLYYLHINIPVMIVPPCAFKNRMLKFCKRHQIYFISAHFVGDIHGVQTFCISILIIPFHPFYLLEFIHYFFPLSLIFCYYFPNFSFVFSSCLCLFLSFFVSIFSTLHLSFTCPVFPSYFYL